LEDEFKAIRVIAEGENTAVKLTFEVLVTDAVVGSYEKLDVELIRTFHSYFGEDAVLADVPGDDVVTLDIIIGEDYYDSVILGRPVTVSDGIKASHTIFGWMLHGGSLSSAHVNSACVFRATLQEQYVNEVL